MLKIVNPRLKKIILVTSAVTIIALAAVIAFISPITKYLVEKYDEKFIGREITMDLAYVNPFTGYVHFTNFKLHELKSDSVFFAAKGLSLNFALLKLFFKTYEISELTLDHPRGMILQNKNTFNFDDIIKRFTPVQTEIAKLPVHFNILKVKINDGIFYYCESITPINYFIKDVNLESTGTQWNVDSTSGKISFSSGNGSGDIKADYSLNLKTLDFRMAVVAHHFDCEIIEQYLKALSNYGTFHAILDADVKGTGNLHDAENSTTTGSIVINDFHFGKTTTDDYASFDKLVFAMQEVSPKKHIYLIDSLSLTHPYLKYELYDSLNNVERMFGEKGAHAYAVAADPERFNLIVEIGRYVKLLVKNFFDSYYRVNRFAIYNGDLKYNDYTLSEKFSTELNPLFIVADSIDKNHDRVKATFKSGIKPYGNGSITLSINPKDTGDFDMQYHFQKIPASMFNPYLISYTSFPVDCGTIELNGIWNVRNGSIQSMNHLLVIDPRVTKRIKNKNDEWLPLPLIMSFVREYGNVIDYEIPITGNLKNPHFHLRDVLSDIVGNIFIKPPTTPYRMEVKKLETKIEKSLMIKWSMRQTVLRPQQENFANKMAGFLKRHPEASIAVYPMQYALKEKEYILFYESKKKYFMQLKEMDDEIFSEDDSAKVDKMSIRDTLFLRYLTEQSNDSTMFTIQEKCNKLVGSSFVNSQFNKLNKERENVFLSYFKDKSVEKQITFHPGEQTIPYDGFTFYTMVYNGDLPNSLAKAYRKIQELDGEGPRKKYERSFREID